MGRKTGILIALIFFLLGYAIKYLLDGYTEFGLLLTSLKGSTGFVLGILIGFFGGSDVLAFIYNWYQERKENRRVHHEDLINTVIKPWYKHDTMSSINEPFAMEHLRKGYPDIHKMWFKDIFELKHQIPEDKKKIREYIKNKLVEGNNSYSKLDDVFDGEHYITNQIGEIICHVEVDKIYKLVNDFTVDCKLKSDGYYKEYVDPIIKDGVLCEMFEIVNANTELLNTKTDEFEGKLKKLAHDVETRMRDLKGTCDDC